MISGHSIGNAQLTFLQQQLKQAAAERAKGQWRALVIATHHPPFTGSPDHVPSPTMLQQIDQACTAAGIQPDLHLSGHAHLYERYTRTIGKKQVPYLVAGMGGYYNLPGLKPGTPAPTPKTPMSGKDSTGNPLTLETYNDNTFGFLRMTVSPSAITGVFITVDPSSGKTGVGDSFTVDLKANTVSTGTSGAAPSKPTKGSSAKNAPKAGSAQRKSAAKQPQARKI